MTSTRNLPGVVPRVTALAAGLAMAFAAAGMGIADDVSSVVAGTPRATPGSNWSAIMPLRPLRSPQMGNRARADVQVGHGQAPRPPQIQTVTNCDDSGPGSLRDELAAAVSGDTIDLSTLACGTITLTSGRLFNSAAYLTIQGPGRDALTIDGNHADMVLYSVGSVLTIADLTIANGSYSAGYGGCLSVFGDLELAGSRVTGCSAGDGTNAQVYGAGIDVRGNLTMQSSTISGSTATATETAVGGGAYVGGNAYLDAGSSIEGNHVTAVGTGYARGGGLFVQGNVYLDESVVSANTVSAVDSTAYGGGIHANGGFVGVYSSRIEGNSAHSESEWSYGGGIQAGDNFGDVPGDIYLESSTISGNSTTANCDACFIQGGGAHAFGQIYSIFSTIRDNIVQSASASEGVARGGGLATFQYDTDGLVIVGISTISGNAALGGTSGYGYGGGVAVIQSSAYALGATIAFNQASTTGGGVTVDDTDTTTFLSGSIVANNLAPDSADIAPGVNGSATVVIDGDHNLVTQVGADVTLPGDTLSDDPLLLPLASNGGPTATHALPVCSPAVDASTNPNSLPFDQRGDPYVRESGIAADIGAFELQPDPDRIFAGGFESSPCP